MIIKCAIACLSPEGNPSFLFVKMEGTPVDMDNGIHYDTAKRYAEALGYDGLLVYDHDDDRKNGDLLFKNVNWATIPMIPIDFGQE